MKSKLLIAALTFLFGACSSPKPALQEYIVTPKVSVVQSKMSKYKEKIVKVTNVYAAKDLHSRSMFYVEDGMRKFAYASSEWAESPQQFVHKEVMQMLAQTKVFGFVQLPSSKVESDFILETRLNDFTQYFEENDKKSYAVVSVTFTLVNSKKHTIVASKTFSSKIDVSSLNAVGGVKALSIALKEVLSDASVWIVKVAQ